MDFTSFNNFAIAPSSEDGVVARFYDRTIKTEKLDAHGFPVFAEVCFCEIRLKDNVSEVFDQPATIDKIRRFPNRHRKSAAPDADKQSPGWRCCNRTGRACS